MWLIIFQLISLFGISEYIAKEVGADRTRGAKYLTHGLLLVLVFSLISAVTMTAGALLFKYPEKVKYGIMTASLTLPFTACILICQSIFTAFQKIKYIAVAGILENLLFLLLGSAVILRGYGLINLIWSLVLARFLASVLNLFMAHRYITPLHFQIDWEFFWRLLPPVAVFGLTGVAFHIFMRIDVVMLSKMRDMVTVGLYSSASKLMEICLMLPLTFYFLNLPIAAEGYKNFRKSVHQKIEAHIEQFFILVFFVFVFGIFFPETILGIIYGKPFVQAAMVLRLLMVAFLIQSAEITLEMSCQAAGYHKVVLRIAIVRAGTNVVLNFVFIPVWGALGAAFATLFSISLSFAMFQYFVKRTLGHFQWIRMAIKPALLCLSILFLLFLLADRLNTLLLALMFLLGYAFSLFALNGFSFKRTTTPLSER